MSLHAVLLAGGPGTRFWPWSRAGCPKPFLPIAGPTPLLRESATRVLPLVPAARLWVVTHRTLVPHARRVLRDLRGCRIVGEPRARNTAASIGAAAALALREDADATLAVLPSDHSIRPRSEFLRALRAGASVSEDGSLVLFGIRPDAPATGYGWVRRGASAGRTLGLRVFEVAGFHEKPNRRRALRYLRSGRYWWNSGAFVFRADAILEEIGRCLPRLARSVSRLRAADRRGERRAFEGVFRDAPAVSIDRGVLEHASRLRMVEPRIRWSDVGSWASLDQLLRGGSAGNVVRVPRGGGFVGIDARRCLVWSSLPHWVTAIGTEDLVIAHTRDATLVCPRSRSEEVREIVEELRRRGRREVL
jgi:mannose-1-phosphate guanylyltransferase/mannose-6-phosphate isomerase